MVTGVEDNHDGIPSAFELNQNYPNPFNPSTVISYQLPINSNVRLKVYDILGRDVTILVNKEQEAGTHEIRFDASRLSSGVYFYRIEIRTNDGRVFTSTRKGLLLK